jgi:hypothetical protein
MVKQHTGHPPRHWFFLWKTAIPHGKSVNSEKSKHLPCSMQVAILVLALTEKDEAMKGGRAALTLKRRRNTSHIKKRKRYMQRPPEAALTGRNAA